MDGFRSLATSDWTAAVNGRLVTAGMPPPKTLIPFEWLVRIQASGLFGLAGARQGPPGPLERMFRFSLLITVFWFFLCEAQASVRLTPDSPVSRLKSPRPYPVVFSRATFCLAGRTGVFSGSGARIGESGFLRWWNREHFPSGQPGERR